MDFGFGVSKSEGFFLDSSDAKELEVRVDVTLTEPNDESEPWASGSLFFLEANAHLDPAHPTTLSGSIGIDITDPGNDGHLSFTEMSGGGSYFVTKADLNLDLNLQTDLGATGMDGMPRLFADLAIDWLWSPSGPTAGSAPTVALNNITLDVGAFVLPHCADSHEQRGSGACNRRLSRTLLGTDCHEPCERSRFRRYRPEVLPARAGGCAAW